MENKTLGTVDDWSKPGASRSAAGGGRKNYDIPFKALMKGTISVLADSKKKAFAEARKLLRNAGVKVASNDPSAPLPEIVSKKQSVKTTKK